MKEVIRKFWGWPSRYRTAYSFVLGLVFGLAIPFSSFWYFLLVIVFCLRTHFVSAVCGWPIGFICYFIFRGLYEPIGQKILIPCEPFWQKLFSIPIFSCLDLRYADVMGSIAFSLLVTVIVVVIIKIVRMLK